MQYQNHTRWHSKIVSGWYLIMRNKSELKRSHSVQAKENEKRYRGILEKKLVWIYYTQGEREWL